MKKVYIAAPWPDRLLARAVAQKVRDLGYVITHHWWAFEAGDEDHRKLQELAALDFNGIAKADIFVLLNFQKKGEETSGKAVETGIALTLGLPIMLIGERTNIFHYLPSVVVYPGIDAALASLDETAVSA